MTLPAYAFYKTDVVRNALLSCRCQWNIERVNTRTRSCHPRRHHSLPPPIPNRLRHMRPKNVGATSKISNRPRHPQNAMHRPRRQLQQINRVFQHRLIVRRESTDRIRFRLIKMRVAVSGALPLHFARTNHACAHHITGFTRRRIGSQFRRWQSRHFHMKIDTFEQRPRNLAAITQDRFGMAATSPRRIACPATRTERRCLFAIRAGAA